MPRKPKPPKSEVPLALVPPEILDQFVRQGPLTAEELEAAVRRFKKAIIERAFGGELTHHFGYAPGGAKPEDVTNHRNRVSGKTVLTDDGPLSIDVPRDREGTFEPRLIPKHERRFTESTTRPRPVRPPYDREVSHISARRGCNVSIAAVM
jgi:putative transposase